MLKKITFAICLLALFNFCYYFLIFLKAAQIEKLLENEINILVCHEKIRELESMHVRALAQVCIKTQLE